MNHIKYHSIEQFRHIVTAVNKSYNYVGYNEETQEPIFDHSITVKPTLKFKGTVKIHGTNAGVSFNKGSGLWAQARKHNITVGKDNAGFAFFVENNKDTLMNLIGSLAKDNNIDLDTQTITVYGEWAGKGIQKGIAIAELEKSFYIFGAKVSEEDKDSFWIDSTSISDNESRIYNVHNFKTYEIEVDFNNPQMAQNKMIEMTLEVEEECPIAKGLGVSGIGEGIVFLHDSERYPHLMFKSKGEKHSKTRVKTLKEVDVTKLEAINNCAEEVTPPWRLEQFLNEVCDLNNGGTIERKHIPDFIRAVIGDIAKEDLDIFNKYGLEPKEVNKTISNICRNYFFKEEANYLKE